MNTPTRQERLLASVETTLPLVKAEMDKAQEGKEAIDSLRSLTFIVGRLQEIAQMLRAGAICKDERYKGSMGHIIVDTWPLNDSLGASISRIEYEFYRI